MFCFYSNSKACLEWIWLVDFPFQKVRRCFPITINFDEQVGKFSISLAKEKRKMASKAVAVISMLLVAIQGKSRLKCNECIQQRIKVVSCQIRWMFISIAHFMEKKIIHFHYLKCFFIIFHHIQTFKVVTKFE